MSVFSITQPSLSTVLYLHSEKDTLQLDPAYQRQSEIWSLEKRQLLIDSIINGFDIPKIYFHKFARPKRIKGKLYSRAIIDGKQRLTSIWNYIDGRFALSKDIEYILDPKIDVRGLTYAELGKAQPRLKLRLDSYPLSIVEIETDDIELIEDLFSRLNEAVPLSAAEKRNAFGGPMPKIIRNIATTRFCREKLPFGNQRYRHFDVIAKFLLIEEKREVVDTKKKHLDEFVREWKSKRSAGAEKIGAAVKNILQKMSARFTDADELLRSVGMLTLYYHIFRLAINNKWLNEITRSKLAQFERDRIENRKQAEEEIGDAEYDLLEFDSYVQTPNDSHATTIRLRILLRRIFDRDLAEELG